MRVGLRSWRGALRNRRAQIPETRWRNNSKTLTHKFRRIGEALVKAAPRAMDRQKREASTPFRILGLADFGVGDQTAAARGIARTAYLILIRQENCSGHCPQSKGGTQQNVSNRPHCRQLQGKARLESRAFLRYARLE